MEPFKVYPFDEEANSLIAFQTFREERGNHGGIETWALVLHWSTEKELCVKRREREGEHNNTLFSTYVHKNEAKFRCKKKYELVHFQ